jgi:NifB/MoaA-like Fe-S oxidoreductase
VIATGVSAAPHIKRLCETYAPGNATVHVETIINHFFGETVTVAGLLTGGDVLEQLSPTLLQQADTLLISASMLRHDRDMFLCGMTFEEFKRRLPLPVRVTDDGFSFYNVLHNR